MSCERRSTGEGVYGCDFYRCDKCGITSNSYFSCLEKFPEMPLNTIKTEPEYTGGSVSYYTVSVKKPTTEGRAPYDAECNDIIESLGMNYAEGNAFKAIWRMCAARKGLGKKGYKDGLYDAEKVVFFGERMVFQNGGTE